MSKCESCKTQNAAINCGACEKVKYCSEVCQKKHWKKHKSSCRLTKVCVIENEEIQERDYALIDLSESSGWQTCQVPNKLGIPLIFKQLESKRMRSNKFGHILMVEPDMSLLENDLYEVVNGDDDDDDLVVKHENGFLPYKWSEKAWRADLTNDKHGILMFALKDRQDLSADTLTDLFNYIYEIMEFYSQKTSESLKHVKKMCIQSYFSDFRKSMTTHLRRQMTKLNYKKYPNCVSGKRSVYDDIEEGELELMKLLILNEHLNNIFHY
jgi:hypothetical protein